MDVFFESPKSKTFSIEVGYFDTVLEIKEKIQKYQGIPIPNQTLIFNGQVLQDERDIEYCEILHNSHIQLLIASDNQQSSLPNDTVLHLKETMQDMQSSHGGEFPDNRALRESEMVDNGEVNVNIKPSPTGSGAGNKKLKLMVVTKCGSKKIPVEVNASDNVGVLRKELQKLHQRLHFQLPAEGYFFIYKQNVMDDDRSFRWHHVCQGDTIEIFNGSVSGGS